MDPDFARRVADTAAYRELKRSRNRFGWALTLAMLAVYYGFIVLVAFDKPFLAQRLGSGVTTVGMPIGLGVILFTVAITAYYVRRANRRFDTLSEKISQGVLQ
jgi:uncharacterized membrane protein (DUF485 family)